MGEISHSLCCQRRNVETNPYGTIGNCKVQEPSKGINVLVKHARSDRISGLTVQPAYRSHLQCAIRAHDITGSPGIPMASCGGRPISDWWWSPSSKVELLTQLATKYSTTYPAVISRMKAIFSRFGIPEKVVSDYGPPFAGGEFSLAFEMGEFHHVTKSPLNPK